VKGVFQSVITIGPTSVAGIKEESRF
jgi:hypothetical protein